MSEYENSEYMSEDERSKCHAIIHSAAVAAGAVGAGLAQLPMADNLAIMPLQIGMVASLGNVFGKSLGETAIKSLISAAAGTVVGRSASQALLGWIPLFGNVINASTAFALTEAIGWAIANNFAIETMKAKQRIKEEEERRRIEEERSREERRRIEEERRKIEEEERIAVSSPVRNMVSQITATLTKTFGSMFNLVCSLPMGLVRVVVYVVSSIAGAIRVLWRMLKEFFTGEALRVIWRLCSQIWSCLLSLGTNIFNFVMYIWAWLPVGLALLWIFEKANILPPEYQHYLTMARDFIQFVKK